MAESKKAWGGRFSKPTSKQFERFSESISFDARLYDADIRGSIAHATMLAECGLISKTDCSRIVRGLKAIGREIEAGTFEFREDREDIHMNVEAALVERIGDAGKKLHTARSRNDQVALDLRLWAIDEVAHIYGLLRETQAALVGLAEANVDLIIPAYTHMQHAQPVLAAHSLLAYVEMFERDIGRLGNASCGMLVSPLGSGAVAGSGLPIDPDATAKHLGLPGVAANSIDATCDRDFILEMAFALAMIAMHLSRWAEEWIIWSTEEFGFIELDDSVSTGSSMMPQKKNPDALELIRGKTARVYGNLVALLTLMKGLPLAYNRDLQEDKPPIFDSTDTVADSLAVAIEVIDSARFKPERIAQQLDRGHLDATSLADYLVLKGVPFREAHHTVGALVKACTRRGCRLGDLSLEDFQQHSDVIGKDVTRALGPENCVKRYRSKGSSQPRQVKAELSRWQKHLKD